MPSPTLNQVHVSQALTNLSVGYRQDKPAISDLLFPVVTTDNQKDVYYIWNKADQWRRQANKRAPGTKFTRGKLSLGTDNFNSEQYSWEYVLPDEIKKAADDVLELDTTISNTIMDTLMLEKDMTFANDFMASTAGWISGTLGAGKWNTANSTPIEDILAAARLIRRGLGSARNYKLVAVVGSIVEIKLLGNAEFKEAIKYTQTVTIDNLRTIMAAAMGIDQLIVADREVTTSKEGAAVPTYAPVFDDDLLLCAVPNAPGRMTPAAGYTFAWSEDGFGDTYVDEYRDETIKSDIKRGITYYDQKVVDANLGVLFLDCVD